MATYSTIPAELNVTLVKGDEWGVSLDFDIDLTGYTFNAIVFATTRTVSTAFPGGIDTEGATAATIAVTFTDLANGQLGLSLTEAQTESLDEASTYRWYLRGVAPGTITRTYISGSFTVRSP